MANTDVRSMLRNERLSRRIDHPYASYTSTGGLMCSICQLQIRADALWEPHLAGRPHKIMLQRLQDGTQQTPSSSSTRTESNGKKRKADDEDEDEDPRKKIRAIDELPKTPTRPAPNEVQMASHGSKPTPAEPASNSPLPSATVDAIDEDEWAAFERDVATPPPTENPNVASALTAAATISVAPITAAELAARSREEASIQAKEKREAELEGEKEDAARQLEEEFDEMEELEGKVRRLREMREALRARRTEGAVTQQVAVENVEESNPVEDEDDEDDDDDDYDELEGWGLR